MLHDLSSTIQVPLAFDRPSGAISWLPLQSLYHSILGKSYRAPGELRPRAQVLTRLHCREVKEQPRAEDLQLRLVRYVSICVPELARFLLRSYGRDIPRSQAANLSAISAALQSGFRQIAIWPGPL